MRIAIVSDIHGNLSALEAVVSDIDTIGVDLVIHAGDLVGSGSSSAEVVDRIRELSWAGIYGNTDEVHWKPQRLEELAARTPSLQLLWDVVRADVARTHSDLGDERVRWLSKLPDRWQGYGLTIVHASAGDPWKSPAHDSPDDELARVYAPLGTPLVVYGHIHRPFVRQLQELTVANSGSVGLSYDGDPRAAYLLIADRHLQIRRVPYDVEAEVQKLLARRFPLAAWIAAQLRTATYMLPP